MKILLRPKIAAQSQKPSGLHFLILAVCCMLYALSLSGCIRISGNAGYQTIKDDEVVTKSTGFDVDSSRLVDNRGIN